VDRFVELADLAIESEDEALTLAPASPRELVQRAVGAVREEARSRRILISERLPEALPHVSAHAPRLTRALTHLLSSAVRSSPEGGIVTLKACAEGESLQIDVLLEEGAASAPLEVLGAGRLPAGGTPGGSQADQALGLLLARRIIREHGGDVRLSAPARPRGGPAGLSVILPSSSAALGSGTQAPETVSAGGEQPSPPPAAV
jgi:signal transduction histidine kinase